MKFLLSSLILGLTFNSYALVDYSEPPTQTGSKASGYNPVSKSKRVVKSPRAKDASSSSNFSLLPKSTDILLGFSANKSSFEEENINILNLKVSPHFGYGVYFDLGIQAIQDLESDEYEQGNSDIKMGINWLDIGDSYNKLVFDVFAGMRLDGKSVYATQRTDNYYGVSSEKRFGPIAMGFSYERALTDDIDDGTETMIGDISHLKGDLGIMISSEIQFVFTYGDVKIESADNKSSSNALQKEIRYSYVTPQMYLKMMEGLRLNLGASFQVKRPDSELVDGNLKVWNLPAAYGNSLFAGVKIEL